MTTLMTFPAASHQPLVSPGTPSDRSGETVPHKLLTAHGPLALLPEQDLASLLQWSKIWTPRRREVIFRQGDPGSNVVLVLDGFVKLATTLRDGREVVLDVIGPGGCAGEVASLYKTEHETDATALMRCRLLLVDARQFRHALERRPESLPMILRLVSERLHRTREQMADSLGLSAAARLAKAVMRMAMLWSTGLRPGERVRLRLSQSELGSMTGLSRESVNKILGTWRDAGWIKLSNRSVTILNIPALARITQAVD